VVCPTFLFFLCQQTCKKELRTCDNINGWSAQIGKGVTCKQKAAGLNHTMDGILYRILYGTMYMVDNMLSAADNMYLW
jgi:hypothetical protein